MAHYNVNNNYGKNQPILNSLINSRLAKTALYIFIACNFVALISGGFRHRNSLFTDPELVTSPPDAINLVIVAANITRAKDDIKPGQDPDSYARFLSTFLLSMDARSDRAVLRDRLNLIILTDDRSAPVIDRDINEYFPGWNLTLIDVNSLEPLVSKWSKEMRSHFGLSKSIFTIDLDDDYLYDIHFVPNYESHIFYLSPFYHWIFPKLDKLLVMDLDMRFDGAGLEDVWNLFDSFSSKNLVGLANDQKPHYHLYLQNGYSKAHPGSQVGSPGPHQGLNVGLILLRLDRIRDSIQYRDMLTIKAIRRIGAKYFASGSALGAQDWFTGLSWEMPELVYIVPCQYNHMATKAGYDFKAWVDMESQFKCQHQGSPLIQHGKNLFRQHHQIEDTLPKTA